MRWAIGRGGFLQDHIGVCHPVDLLPGRNGYIAELRRGRLSRWGRRTLAVERGRAAVIS